MKQAIIILLLLLPTLCSAYDIALTPTITELPADGNILHLFRIENLEHVLGSQNKILVNLTYSITFDEEIVHGSSQHVINKYTTNTPGFVVRNATSIHLCGTISANVSDNDLNNNQGCWSIFSPDTGNDTNENETDIPLLQNSTNEGNTTLENSTQPPVTNTTVHFNTTNTTLPSTPLNETFTDNQTTPTNTTQVNSTIVINNTTITNTTQPQENETQSQECTDISIEGLPQMSDSGVQLSYKFAPWKSGDSVEYWIEDLFGKTVKTSVATTSSTKRTYTPKISSALDVFVFKAKRERPGCPQSSAQELVIIVGEEKGEESDDAEEEFIDEITVNTYDETLKGGSAGTLSMSVEKADNRARVIEIKSFGKTGKIKLQHQGVYEITLPLFTPHTCMADEYEEEIIISGLGDKITVPVTIIPAPCAEKSAENSSEENLISSLYIRAQKYQPNITLYGTTLGGTFVLAKGDGEHIDLAEGTFSHTITPMPGNNTYYLLRENEGGMVGKRLDFFLRSDSDTPASTKVNVEKRANEDEETDEMVEGGKDHQTTTSTMMAGSTTFTPEKITGNVVTETENRSGHYLIIGSIVLVSVLLALIVRRKTLIRKKHLAKE